MVGSAGGAGAGTTQAVGAAAKGMKPKAAGGAKLQLGKMKSKQDWADLAGMLGEMGGAEEAPVPAMGLAPMDIDPSAAAAVAPMGPPSNNRSFARPNDLFARLQMMRGGY